MAAGRFEICSQHARFSRASGVAVVTLRCADDTRRTSITQSSDRIHSPRPSGARVVPDPEPLSTFEEKRDAFLRNPNPPPLPDAPAPNPARLKSPEIEERFVDEALLYSWDGARAQVQGTAPYIALDLQRYYCDEATLPGRRGRLAYTDYQRWVVRNIEDDLEREADMEHDWESFAWILVHGVLQHFLAVAVAASASSASTSASAWDPMPLPTDPDGRYTGLPARRLRLAQLFGPRPLPRSIDARYHVLRTCSTRTCPRAPRARSCGACCTRCWRRICCCGISAGRRGSGCGACWARWRARCGRWRGRRGRDVVGSRRKERAGAGEGACVEIRSLTERAGEVGAGQDC